MSGNPFDKYKDTATPVGTSIQGCGMIEVRHELFFPDDLGQREPAAGVPFKLQTPHGRNIFGVTDANGLLHYEGTGEGVFHIEFEPTLHKEKELLLKEIRTAFDEVVAAERKETDDIIKELEAMAWYEKAGEYGMSFAKGVWKGLVGIVEFVGAVLWGAAKGLYHASKYMNPLTAPETFKQDMAALKETYQELKEFKDDDLETYLILANDDEAWKLFTDFAKDYVDAQHTLEWTEGGGETVFAIILVIVTAGAGAAAAAGGAGSRLATLGQKLSGPIKRLIDILKRQRNKKKVKDETNHRVESDTVITNNKSGWVAPATKPQSSTYNGKIYRYEVNNPDRLKDTWKAHDWNKAANHRYTQPGTSGVYAGTTEATARAEISHYGAYDGRVLVTKDIKKSNLLDLRKNSVRKQMGLNKGDLTNKDHDYKLTQDIGEWSKKEGYTGIVAPSARDKGGANIILFDGL